jgi:PTS system mannose-specific IID component
MGQTSVVVADVLNSIFPGILSIVLVLFLMSLIKKGRRPVQLIVGIFAVAFIGAFIGIF